MVVIVVISAVAGAADNNAPVVDVDENAVRINCVFPLFCFYWCEVYLFSVFSCAYLISLDWSFPSSIICRAGFVVDIV